MPKPGQVIGRRESTGAGADNEHSFAGGLRCGLEAPLFLACGVAEKALDRVDGHRCIEICSVADGFAWVIAHPAVDGGERIVSGQLTPGPLVLADAGVGEPGLDVFAGRATGVAGRQQVDVQPGDVRGPAPRGAVRVAGRAGA